VNSPQVVDVLSSSGYGIISSSGDVTENFL
jgi:hypothetical protein